MKNGIRILCLLVSVALLFASCSKEKEPQAAGTEKTEGAANIKTAYYFPIPHPFGESVQKGVAAYAEDKGIEVYQQIGTEWTQDSQNVSVEALASKGYKSFLIYPVDPSAANGLYQELVDNGMSIINFGTSTVQPTPASFAVATDVKQAAVIATEKLIEAMGGKGNIINVLEVLTDANTILRKEGVEEVVAKYPDVNIVQEIGDMSTLEEATEKVENAIASNLKAIDGVICTGYTTTVATAQLLDELNTTVRKDDPIRFVGIDDDAIVLDAIRNGTIDGTIAQNPYGMGYIGCFVAEMLQNGYSPREGAYFIDSGIAYVSSENVDNFSETLVGVTNGIIENLEKEYLQK